MKHQSIAIDGPSGAGKSTLAKMIAEQLGFLYIDTGAMYRTVALYVKEKGVVPTDATAVEALLPEIQIDFCYLDDGLQHMLLNGEDVTAKIREHSISAYASTVSAHPSVRAFLLELQRKLVISHSIIMDGRDIGTVVLPMADLKIFLTADVEDRAMRRYKELLERGQEIEYATVLQDIQQRDENDSNRAVAPLRPAEDSVVVDTTGNTLEESFAVLLEIVKGRLGQ